MVRHSDTDHTAEYSLVMNVAHDNIRIAYGVLVYGDEKGLKRFEEHTWNVLKAD